MKQPKEESAMTWKSLLERLLDNLGLKLVILKLNHPINYESYDARIATASENSICAIHTHSGESILKAIDGNYYIRYPIRHIFGSTEEEVCSRMLKAIVGTEICWVKKDNSVNFIEICHVKVPRILTSSIHAAKINLDMMEIEHGA